MERFGEGLTPDEYIRKRLIFACEVAELDGSDGWHDAFVAPAAEHERLETLLEDAILEASLAVGGRIVARDPDYHSGVIDAIAHELSSNAPTPKLAEARVSRHRIFLARALQNLRGQQ